MLTDIQKRILLFLCFCITTRILLAYIAKTTNPEYLQYMGIIALLPAVSFMYIYLSDSRKTGPEVFGDQIWWNSLRPIHSLLYFLFAYNAINKNENAWIFLALDAALGLFSFLNFHKFLCW